MLADTHTFRIPAGEAYRRQASIRKKAQNSAIFSAQLITGGRFVVSQLTDLDSMRLTLCWVIDRCYSPVGQLSSAQWGTPRVQDLRRNIRVSCLNTTRLRDDLRYSFGQEEAQNVTYLVPDTGIY